jgi:hypothetical protein
VVALAEALTLQGQLTGPEALAAVRATDPKRGFLPRW